jgi:hypothetical protein
MVGREREEIAGNTYDDCMVSRRNANLVSLVDRSHLPFPRTTIRAGPSLLLPIIVRPIIPLYCPVTKSPLGPSSYTHSLSFFCVILTFGCHQRVRSGQRRMTVAHLVKNPLFQQIWLCSEFPTTRALRLPIPYAAQSSEFPPPHNRA